MSETPASGLPRITILTPCFNAECYIAEAVESARRQHYPDLEHVILDAGSKDGTLAALKPFAGLHVVSEPDRGSHDAMNKGLRLATGEVVGFLNSDDFYADDLLLEVGRTFGADQDLDVVVVGTVVFADGEDGARRVLVARDHRVADGSWLSELAFGAPGFNGRFYRRRLFERLGGFDLDYDFSADRHFLTRIALAGLKSKTLSRFGYFFRSHPASRTLDTARRNAETFAREHMQMALDFSRQARLPAQRRFFLAWHAFEGAKIAYFEMGSGRLGAAFSALWHLTAINPVWPLRLPLAFARRREVRQREADNTAQMSDGRGASLFAGAQNPFGW